MEKSAASMQSLKYFGTLQFFTIWRPLSKH